MNLFIETQQRKAEHSAWIPNERPEDERPSAGRQRARRKAGGGPIIARGNVRWRAARAADDGAADASTWQDGEAPASRTASLGDRGRAEAGPYSQEQATYQEELAFNKRRARRRSRNATLRVLAFVLLLPVLLVVVFVATYALTCILSGASPDDLVQLLVELFERAQSAAIGVLHNLKN